MSVSRSLVLHVVAGLALLVASRPATGDPDAPSGPPPLAFVDVSVVSLDRDGVLPHHTVLVRGDRIAAVGPVGEVEVPPDATVVPGAGRFLLPGLVDAHVHLDRHIGARPDFGDAPLYLASGVTTVFNLRGDPEHIEWKRRIASGELLAPNLYTSGEFVNEPRVNTPEEARREVQAQIEAGYDLMKFREVIDFDNHRIATTTGLNGPAYLALLEAARESHLPLVGHAPYAVGLDGLLEGRQSLAHTNELANLYFLPPLDLSRGTPMLLARWSWLALLVLVLGWNLAALAVRLRRRPADASPGRSDRVVASVGLVLSILVIALWLLAVPPGWAFGSVPVLLALSVLAVAFALLALDVVRRTVRGWRRAEAGTFHRLILTATAAAALAFAAATAWWVSFAWRGTDASMARVARDLAERGIWVQSTLSVYELGMARRDGWRIPQQIEDPAFRYLPADPQESWSQIQGAMPGWMAIFWRRHPEFTRQLLSHLHEEGVLLTAGTDAMGVPFQLPGVSLHKELQLLLESGLTPREALWTATVGPARFIGHEDEFGTVAVGRRADLVLVEGNPLEDLGRLRHPTGVVVRGHWLSRETLQGMLAPLASEG